MPKKLRKMLGAADSTYIVSLMRLIETQSKATIAKWCMDYCEAHILPIFEKHCSNDDRPRHAIEVQSENQPTSIIISCFSSEAANH